MDSKLDRRQLLKVAGAAVLGASLGSCARATSPSKHFAKVNVSPRAGDPDHRRLASVSQVRIPPRGRALRRNDRCAQLRPRLERRLDVAGHGSSGDGMRGL
mgnify:CR=1 FL=1